MDVVDTIWQDIKSLESGFLLSVIASDDRLKSMDEKLSSIFGSIDNYASDFISMDYWDIAEEVESDLYKCAINRLVNGRTDNLFENMFLIYQSGGWPCGWDGKYPAGKIICYAP
ncbi:cytoplasmic protein [Paenibacillus sp. GCM10027627]|uniref:cytoplasmic protein n=1 Tax=unclassified Paenibacillus TaxID=185978 RepID=UPI00363BA015